MAILLGILLINFFLFNHYYSAVNELQQTSQINKSSSSKSSFYVNAIIESLPTTILLSELNYQPLLKRIKAEKAIENEVNTILISGASTRSVSFSKWITSLEFFDWTRSVEILSYKDISKSTSDFSIKLKIARSSF